MIFLFSLTLQSGANWAVTWTVRNTCPNAAIYVAFGSGFNYVGGASYSAGGHKFAVDTNFNAAGEFLGVQFLLPSTNVGWKSSSNGGNAATVEFVLQIADPFDPDSFAWNLQGHAGSAWDTFKQVITTAHWGVGGV